jgi:hypothetical protein
MTRKTPAFVRDFLYQWWTKTLVDAYMKERDGDDSWTHRLGTVDALVWSVSPLKTGEIQQLASMLPTLMRSLLRGMNAIEMPADARHGFFNQLMQAHTASINVAKAQTKGPAVPTAADVARVEEAQAEEAGPPEEPADDQDDYYVHTAMAVERGAVVEFMDGTRAVRAKLSGSARSRRSCSSPRAPPARAQPKVSPSCWQRMRESSRFRLMDRVCTR